MFYEVAELLEHYDKVVFLGDYVDNWNTPAYKSIGAWKALHMLMQSHPDKVHAVIGNHDYSYIHPEIAGRSSGWNPDTFTALTFPENKYLKEWLLSLPVTIELDGVTFSHAGVTEQWNGQEDVPSLWNDASPIWARPRQMGGNVTYVNIPQVIGHNPSQQIWNPEPNIWCVDTFSEHQDNSPIGDQSLLEIIDGKEFNIFTLEKIQNENNDDTSGVEDQVS
jgi:hypothetical protein